MLPQSVREEGGYRLKGRTQSEIELLINDAHAVEEAGAFAVVLKIVTPEARQTNYRCDRDSDDRDWLRGFL